MRFPWGFIDWVFFGGVLWIFGAAGVEEHCFEAILELGLWQAGFILRFRRTSWFLLTWKHWPLRQLTLWGMALHLHVRPGGNFAGSAVGWPNVCASVWSKPNWTPNGIYS